MNPALQSLYKTVLGKNLIKITQAKEKIEVTVIDRLHLYPLVYRFHIGDEAIRRGGESIVYCFHLELEDLKPNCKCNGISVHGHLYIEQKRSSCCRAHGYSCISPKHLHVLCK